MLSKSRIEKGKRFEIKIAKEIMAEGLGLARRESGSGSGKRKGDIAASIPFLIEAKNQPSVKIKAILKWIDQSKYQTKIGNYDRDKWALVFRDPRSPEDNPKIYTVIDFWEFLKLLKTASEPRIKEPDRDLKFWINKLKVDIKQVDKRI